MLTAVDVQKKFGGNQVLDGVSLAIEPSEIVGLVGPNGSGKTTMLNCLSGFVKPDGGEVTLNGRVISGSPAWKVSRLGLRRTFQLPQQPLKMTALESMLCGASLPTGAKPIVGLVATKKRRAEEREAIGRAWELFEVLKLASVAHTAAGRLSGGQQKLLSLGVALMDRPSFLLLDEPTAGVNPTLRQSLVDRLLEIRDPKTSLLIVEHDMGFVGRLCDRVYVLDKGEVIASCLPSQLMDNPRVVEAYLGVPRTKTAS